MRDPALNMTEQEFAEREGEFKAYINDYNRRFFTQPKRIKKMRFLYDHRVFRKYNEDSEHPIDEFDLIDIEDNENQGDAPYYVEPDADESEWIEEDGCEYNVMIMFKKDNRFHALREIGVKDLQGNSQFPEWLPENNFTQNSRFSTLSQEYQLKRRHYIDYYHDAFIVFVIYKGDDEVDEVEEEKPITEASRIILEATKERIDKPAVEYTFDYLNVKWTDYLKEHSDLYDENWFALIATKKIRATINWKWICETLNKDLT